MRRYSWSHEIVGPDEIRIVGLVGSEKVDFHVNEADAIALRHRLQVAIDDLRHDPADD